MYMKRLLNGTNTSAQHKPNAPRTFVCIATNIRSRAQNNKEINRYVEKAAGEQLKFIIKRLLLLGWRSYRIVHCLRFLCTYQTLK